MVRLGDYWFRLRRPAPVLLSSYERTQPEQEGDRSTHLGMERTKGRRGADERKVSRADDYAAVFVTSRPLQPRRWTLLCGMSSISIRRTVSFDDDVTVYTPTDWPSDVYRNARIGPWLRMSQNRLRFRHRIHQTEALIGHVFTDSHRDYIKSRFM